MKICHIVGHGDQRAIKECLALKHAGHEITFLTKSVNAYMNFFDYVNFFHTDESLTSAIRKVEADIFHIHCKPAGIPAAAVKELTEAGKPFVYDVHDLDIVRFGKTNSEELFALMNAPNLIFPDPAIEERAKEVFFNHLAEMPRMMSLLPYFSLNDMVYPLIRPNPLAVHERIKNIVYEGNIVIPAIENIKNFPYYDLRFTSHVFHSYGLQFHIYPVGIGFDQARQYYETSDAVMHVPVEYPRLIEEMSVFGWGFFGSFCKSFQASNTFANKVFDYIAAGLPVCVMNADKMGQFLEETGFGVVIRNFDDIEALKEPGRWQQLQQNILGNRVKFSMEENIHKLVTFYSQILGKTDWAKEIEDGKKVSALPGEPIETLFQTRSCELPNSLPLPSEIEKEERETFGSSDEGEVSSVEQSGEGLPREFVGQTTGEGIKRYAIIPSEEEKGPSEDDNYVTQESDAKKDKIVGEKAEKNLQTFDEFQDSIRE